MRPKKKILLIDSDETRCSVRSFVLSNRGFAVYPVANVGDARRTAALANPDLAVLCWPFDGAAALLSELHTRCPQMPSMVIAEQLTEAPVNVFAGAVLLKGGCSQSEIYDRAKVMCARKRGPRKGAQRKMPLADLSAIDMAYLAERRIA